MHLTNGRQTRPAISATATIIQAGTLPSIRSIATMTPIRWRATTPSAATSCGSGFPRGVRISSSRAELFSGFCECLGFPAIATPGGNRRSCRKQLDIPVFPEPAQHPAQDAQDAERSCNIRFWIRRKIGTSNELRTCFCEDI